MTTCQNDCVNSSLHNSVSSFQNQEKHSVGKVTAQGRRTTAAVPKGIHANSAACPYLLVSWPTSYRHKQNPRLGSSGVAEAIQRRNGSKEKMRGTARNGQAKSLSAYSTLDADALVQQKGTATPKSGYAPRATAMPGASNLPHTSGSIGVQIMLTPGRSADLPRPGVSISPAALQPSGCQTNLGMAATAQEGMAPKLVQVNADEPCPIASTEVAAGKTARIYPQKPGLGSNGEDRQERDGLYPERLAAYQRRDGAERLPVSETGRGIIHGRAVALIPATGYEPAEDNRQVPSPIHFTPGDCTKGGSIPDTRTLISRARRFL